MLAISLLSGCGGEPQNSFANSVYISIKPGASLDPASAATLNGYRIVFLNNDSVAHTINWDAPLTLTATANAGDRAWFDLPAMPTGTVLHYHLDSSGAGGTVLILQNIGG